MLEASNPIQHPAGKVGGEWHQQQHFRNILPEVVMVQNLVTKLVARQETDGEELLNQPKACNWQCYLDRYIDLQIAYGTTNTADADAHFQQYGQSEGRDCTCQIQARAVIQEKPLAIVSALFGERDVVTLPLCPTPAHCFLFTDDRRISSGVGWTVDNTPHHEIFEKKYVRLAALGPYSPSNLSKGKTDRVRALLTAKFYKMNAHFLPGVQDYDIILWMDTHFWNKKCWKNYAWNPNLLQNLRMDLQDSNMMIPLHSERTSVAEELVPAGERADEITGGHTGVQDAKRAFEHELADGFADHAGLFNCAFFAYRAHDRLTRDALLGWWREVQMYSFRDQISLPYIKYRFQLKLKSHEWKKSFRHITQSGYYAGGC